jgi:hypothetical protein
MEKTLVKSLHSLVTPTQFERSKITLCHLGKSVVTDKPFYLGACAPREVYIWLASSLVEYRTRQHLGLDSRPGHVCLGCFFRGWRELCSSLTIIATFVTVLVSFARLNITWTRLGNPIQVRRIWVKKKK